MLLVFAAKVKAHEIRNKSKSDLQAQVGRKKIHIDLPYVCSASLDQRPLLAD